MSRSLFGRAYTTWEIRIQTITRSVTRWVTTGTANPSGAATEHARPQAVQEGKPDTGNTPGESGLKVQGCESGRLQHERDSP